MSHEELKRASQPDWKGLEEAAKMMMKRKPGPRYIGRWDWHLWMFLIGCLPSLGIYCLALWVRSDLKKKEQLMEIEKVQKEKELASKPKVPTVGERISDLERQIRALQLQLVLSGKSSSTDFLKEDKGIGNSKDTSVIETKNGKSQDDNKSEKKRHMFQRFWLRSDRSMNKAEDTKTLTDFSEVLEMQELYNKRLIVLNEETKKKESIISSYIKGFFNSDKAD